MRADAARCGHCVQRRRFRRQPAQHLLKRLVAARRSRRQRKFRRTPALLLLMNDALIYVGHGSHALGHHADVLLLGLRSSRLSTHRAIEKAAVGSRLRQAMCLLAVTQLQAMLHVAQEFISRTQMVEVASRKVPFVVQLLQREQRPAGAQPGLAAAIHALQALRQEFDVAYAAATHFHVDSLLRASRPQPARPALRHAAARHQCGLNSHKIQLTLVNVGLHAADEFARKRFITRNVARLDHRLQLPIVGDARVVAQRRLHPDGRLPFPALRPQAQIDAKHRPLRRRLRECLRHFLCQPDKVFACADRRRDLCLVVV